MTELERQVAALLKDAPGEPPITVDPAGLRFTPTSRLRRYLMPLAAAAAVVALAIPAAMLVRHSPTRPAPSSRTTTPTATLRQPASPRQAAVQTAQTIIATAPMVPGATRVGAPPLAMLSHLGLGTTAAQHVERTRFWTAPGTVAAMISYLQAHPPVGMRIAGSGSSTGPGVPTNRSIEFQADEFRSLQYSVVAYRTGVAVGAGAVVLWAPRRVPADTIPASVTGVDVLVVRQNPQLHQGAPTVHLTLGKAAARALAEYVNRLPRAIPVLVPHSCPADLEHERWLDRLVFHSAGPDATLAVDMVGCWSTEFHIGHRRPIQLSSTRADGAASDIDQMIMRAVGLPDNYGR